MTSLNGALRLIKLGSALHLFAGRCDYLRENAAPTSSSGQDVVGKDKDDDLELKLHGCVFDLWARARGRALRMRDDFRGVRTVGTSVMQFVLDGPLDETSESFRLLSGIAVRCVVDRKPGSVEIWLELSGESVAAGVQAIGLGAPG